MGGKQNASFQFNVRFGELTTRTQKPKHPRVAQRPLPNAAPENLYQLLGSVIIAKNQNTFAKRQREMEKKRKAEEKRSRRNERKAEQALPPAVADPEDAEVDQDVETSADDSPIDSV